MTHEQCIELAELIAVYVQAAMDQAQIELSDDPPMEKAFAHFQVMMAQQAMAEYMAKLIVPKTKRKKK